MISLDKRMRFLEVEEAIDRSLERVKDPEAAQNLKRRLLTDYFRDDPKKGGYGDVWAKEKSRDEAVELIRGKISQGFDSSWELYAHIGDQVRQKHQLPDPFETEPEKPKSRKGVIQEMREHRERFKSNV